MIKPNEFHNMQDFVIKMVSSGLLVRSKLTLFIGIKMIEMFLHVYNRTCQVHRILIL